MHFITDRLSELGQMYQRYSSLIVEKAQQIQTDLSLKENARRFCITYHLIGLSINSNHLFSKRTSL